MPKGCRELINLEPTCIMETRLRKHRLPKPAHSPPTAQQPREQETGCGDRQSSLKGTRGEETLALASRKRKATSPASEKVERIVDHDTYGETHVLKSSTSSKFNSRRQLRFLEVAKPRVKLVPFAMHNSAGFVSKLRHQWGEAQNRPVSKKLRARIRDKYPLEFFCGERAESPAATEDPDSDEDSHFFAIITTAYYNAAIAYSCHENEAGWEKVAWAILYGIFPVDVSDAIELMEIHSMQYESTVSAHLFPQLKNLISPKKIGIGIFFNYFHPNVSKLMDLILAKMPDLLLSPAEDMADSPQLVSIEVKSPDGSQYTSSLQLITWLAAGLQQLKELKEQALLTSGKGESEARKWIENDETHPLHSFGISIVGHQWLIFVAVKNDDDDGAGDVNVHGPANMGDTLSCEGILRILRMLHWLKKWGETAYWPWLVKNFLEPLAQQNVLSEDVQEEEE